MHKKKRNTKKSPPLELVKSPLKVIETRVVLGKQVTDRLYPFQYYRTCRTLHDNIKKSIQNSTAVFIKAHVGVVLYLNEMNTAVTWPFKKFLCPDLTEGSTDTIPFFINNNKKVNEGGMQIYKIVGKGNRNLKHANLQNLNLFSKMLTHIIWQWQQLIAGINQTLNYTRTI